MIAMWIGSWAAASPGSAGAVHLGAMPMEANTGYAGAGGVTLWAGEEAIVAPAIEAGFAIGDRFAVIGMATMDLPEIIAFPYLLAGRYLALDEDTFRLALTVSHVGLPFSSDTGRPFETHTSPGFALDAGGDRFRFDMAVPFWGISTVGGAMGPERFPVPILSTLGANFLIGDKQRVRIGMPEFLSWHYRGEHVYIDVGGATVLVAGYVWAKVGGVF